MQEESNLLIGNVDDLRKKMPLASVIESQSHQVWSRSRIRSECEVVPFLDRNNLIDYGSYGGYIYFSKSPDFASHRWHCQWPRQWPCQWSLYDSLLTHD